jgi:hypothetical protein
MSCLCMFGMKASELLARLHERSPVSNVARRGAPWALALQHMLCCRRTVPEQNARHPGAMTVVGAGHKSSAHKKP